MISITLLEQNVTGEQAELCHGSLADAKKQDGAILAKTFVRMEELDSRTVSVDSGFISTSGNDSFGRDIWNKERMMQSAGFRFGAAMQITLSHCGQPE